MSLKKLNFIVLGGLKAKTKICAKNVNERIKMNILVVGLQYGDEAKGRVSAHYLKQSRCEWSVRFNGGPNAGHTVYNNGVKYALHQLPAGVIHGTKVALDAGMVIDYVKLVEECKTVGIDVSDLYVSENAHMIFNEHKERDSEGSGVGSTKAGIAYAYADKALRKGKRAKDFFTKQIASPKLYRGLPPIKDTESAVYESAQAIMLDVDYGCYPYVTSSSVFPSVVHNIGKRVGVMKGYTTRVGDGPPKYPEMEWLSKKGSEIGTTTGRRRKAYWLIVDEIEYALSLLRPDEIVVTKLDILRDEEICVWDRGELITIGDVDSYKQFLLTKFPQIKYFSESPDGDLIKV